MNTPQDNGGQAFPMHERDDALRGMSLRDWFAGQAMQSENIAIAIMVASGRAAMSYNWNCDVAKGAYSIADAMLIARKAPSGLED
jgi:hypothetical protein